MELKNLTKEQITETLIINANNYTNWDKLKIWFKAFYYYMRAKR